MVLYLAWCCIWHGAVFGREMHIYRSFISLEPDPTRRKDLIQCICIEHPTVRVVQQKCTDGHRYGVIVQL